MKKLILATLLSISITASIAQRKVLVEQFTNSGCPSCAGNTPVVASYVNANPNQVLMLAYHTSFPYNDSMYHENALQSTARVAYYGVPSVPASRVDGNYFSGNLVPSISTTIPNRAAVAPRYTVNFVTNNLTGSMLSAQVVFQSIDASNQNENLAAVIVATEKNVLKSSYLASPGANAETEYPWVVRKMLPNENGTALINKQLNGVDTVNISWTANNFKDLNEMRIVAFVQNTVTKEVYQAEISTPQTATGFFETKNNHEELFNLFPTSAKDFINIQLNKLNDDSKIKIVNVLGKTIYTASLNSPNFQIQTSDYASGIYFAQIQSGFKTQTKKFIVSK